MYKKNTHTFSLLGYVKVVKKTDLNLCTIIHTEYSHYESVKTLIDQSPLVKRKKIVSAGVVVSSSNFVLLSRYQQGRRSSDGIQNVLPKRVHCLMVS